MRSTHKRPVDLSSSYFTFEPFGISMTARKPVSMESPSSTSCQACITFGSSAARAPRGVASALDGARREARDVVLHEERIDESDRNGAEQCPGHQLAPVERVAADQLAHDPDRNRTYVRAAE